MEATQRAVKASLKGLKIPPRFVAKVAGMLLEQTKCNPCLHGYPKQIMRYAAQMASFPCSKAPNVYQAWSATQVKSPELQELLTESLNCLNQTIPIIFRATSHLRYLIYTDASDLGWGASLKTEEK